LATILVVDDRPVNREFLTTLLGYRGYHVIEAGDGLEALQQVRSVRPNLAIVDILMPTMDGYEFVQHLRKEPDIAHTRVIFYTATYHEAESRQLAEKCGVTHVLTKPCEPEVVLQVVDEVLREVETSTTLPAGKEFDREHLRLITDKLVRMADDLGHVNERFAELIEINLRLASERDPRKLLDAMCQSARKLIGASYAVLAVGKRNGNNTIYITTSGIELDSANRLEPMSLHQGIMGKVYSERRSQRGSGDSQALSGLGLPSNYPPAHTWLAAPIISIGHTYGWICLTERLGGKQFSSEDEHLLSILAAQVGRIYENGSLYVELQEKEERFRQLAENINEVFFLINPTDTKMLYVSPTYETVWGLSRESLYADPQSWLDAVHTDDRARAMSSFDPVRTHGKFDFTYRIVRLDGAIRWIRARGFPILNSSGEFYRVAGIAEDITGAKLAEEKIQRLNRVHAVLSGINTAIVRIRDRQKLFTEACRIVVEEGQLRMAWIGLLSPDGKVIIPQASAGYEAGYLHLREFSLLTDDPDKSAASGQAIHTRRPVIRNNIARESTRLSLKKDALDRGYNSIASFPLIVSDAAIGVISLYASEPDFFDEDEIKLLIELASDISFAMEFIENENRLNYLAYHDPLTGLTNRASLHQRLVETITGNGNSKDPFSLVLININNFRNINYTLGHHNGDELIRLVARRLKQTVWDSDTVACLGGDDFALLLPRLANKDHIGLVITKILQSFQHAFTLSDIPINVEAALGIALYPDHGENADLLWQHADIALRQAKELHKTHMYYEPTFDHYNPQQLALMGELRKAIDYNQLVLHYQPKIDLKMDRVVGVEALVRWQHPEQGMIYPDQFIPLVENTGLIDPLTIWVMANACRQVHFWRNNGYPLDLSVNLSARNLQNPALKDEILDLTNSSRFPIKHLTLEITESAIMVDPENATEVLAELRAAGMVISVDDFGTGQTSLTYLKELPISKMKIDKSFVMDFKNPRNYAIVRSAIELGHNLGLSVTAEGIEDEHAFLALKDLGCDRGQGYYISKPLPPDQFITWLRKSRWFTTETNLQS